MTGESEKKNVEEQVPEEEPKETPKKVKMSKKDEIEALKEEVAKAQNEAATYLDTARRTQAEFENFRKRTEKDKAEYVKYATSGLVTELIDVAENLEKALASAKQDDPVAVGVKMVHSNLMKILESKGLQEVPAEVFDPNMHEALMVIDGEEDNKIAQVYQKGYMMGGRVLRYAKVVVTRKKEEASASAEESTETQSE
ncbi:MAG: nucleotide exchange factor GrpE [archaeon]|nr:nucleotide exchange factor GrpE [archaeon]